MTILYILIGLVIGSLCVYLIIRPKIKITAQRNEAIEKENQQLAYENENLKNIKEHREQLLEITDREYGEAGTKKQQLEKENKQLLQQQEELKERNNVLTANQQQLRITNTQLETQQNELRKSFAQLKEDQARAAKDYYNAALEVAQTAFDAEIENINLGIENARCSANDEYQELLQDCAESFQSEFQKYQTKINNLKSQLNYEQNLVDSAVAAKQRQAQIEQDKDFYRLQLSEEDIEEIKKIRSILPYLRDKEPLNKVVYKVYYEKPYTALVSRVLPSGTISGIYKITNIQNGMCYVGQSVNIAERWRQHIKRGVGAEAPTKNKLYPAILATGVENFTFELITECEKDKLDELEDFYQNFFHAKDYGYSIK